MRKPILTAILLAPCLASCASSPPPAPEPLPFHLAIVPVESPRVLESRDLQQVNTEMRLDPDCGRLSRELEQALNGGCFTRTTLLTTSPVESEASAPELARRWVDQANAVGADLILQCDLSYKPQIRQEKNSNFWLNVPLFLLGGPAAYWVKDRTYYADAQLTAYLYDLGGADDASLREGNPGIQLMPSIVSFQSLPMNFLNRAGGKGTSFATSIIIPAGFVAKENDHIEEELSKRVLENLSLQLSQSFQSNREVVIRARHARFYLDPNEVALESLDDGSFRIRGYVNLDQKSEIEAMDTFRVYAGEQIVEKEFGEPEEAPDPKYIRYPFQAVLPIEADTRFVRLELEAAGRGGSVRSYTFPAPGHEPKTE